MLRTWSGLAVASALLAASGAAAADERPSLSPRQAEGVATVMRFLTAFRDGDFDVALAQFTRDRRFIRYVGVNDCDYARRIVRHYSTRRSVARWLRERIGDHDRLVLWRLEPIGDRGALLEYSRRTSDTLRRIGYPRGIRPLVATKVGFTTRGPVRMTTFANAGDDASCRPVAAP